MGRVYFYGMRKGQRLISSTLLFVFSVILLKSVLPLGNYSKCNEFAHIHEFNIEKIFQKFSDVVSIREQTADDDCHAAQSVIGSALMLVRPVSFSIGMLVFDLDYSLKNETPLRPPDLGILRRPPRIHAKF